MRISNITVIKTCITNLFTAWNVRECKQQKQQSCNPVLNFWLIQKFGISWKEILINLKGKKLNLLINARLWNQYSKWTPITNGILVMVRTTQYTTYFYVLKSEQIFCAVNRSSSPWNYWIWNYSFRVGSILVTETTVSRSET